MQNPFIWHDLMTTDVEGAKAFYATVLGWTFSVQPPDYHLAGINGKDIGGIMATPAEAKDMPPFWAGYVFTPDVDAACAQVTSLGGTIFKGPWDIPGILRMAIIADPTGATLNVMQPLMQSERTDHPTGTQGTVGWHELHAGDLNTAFDFYAALFGWTKGTTMDMGPMGIYQLFQVGGKDAGGMMKKHPSMPMPCWMYYFNVNGIGAAAARVTAGGGKIIMGPHQVPGGQWIINGMDPQGAMFALVSLTK